jgi:hypothetical protein
MARVVKTKKCDICGVSYNQKKYWQRFCGKSCRQASWAIDKISPEMLKKIVKNKC